MKQLIYHLLMPFAGVLKHMQKNILGIRFYSRYKRCVQWKHPQSFYDKIMWMSCNADTSLWTWLADKYRVREFVAARCGEQLLTHLYGVYDDTSEINYDALPASFVMKTNNGCTSNMLVRDKRSMNVAAVNRQFDKWMKYPYGELTGQLHYAAIEPKIIVEELLKQNDAPDAPLIDYKFYCFNGEPLYCFVVSDRKFNTHNISRMIYDMEWIAHPELFRTNSDMKEISCPSCFEEMKSVARKLSEDINFVRVDLYEVNGRVVFGEMTFMPGWDCEFTEETLLAWGKRIDENKLVTASSMRKKIGL